MNEKAGIASNIQQATIIMRSKAESQLSCFVFFLALAVIFSFSMTVYSGYAHAANCAQKLKQCEKQISKLRGQQLKLGKRALKLVRQRSKIRHEYAPVQSALSEIKTMQGILRDSKAELDAAAKASGSRVSYQGNGRAMGIISASGNSGGSENVQLDIYNTQFDKYQPTLKNEKKLNKKAKRFQKKLGKINKAIAKTDKKSAAIKKKITVQQKKCRKLVDDCHGKKKQSAKTNRFGGYGNGGNIAGNGYGGYDNEGQGKAFKPVSIKKRPDLQCYDCVAENRLPGKKELSGKASQAGGYGGYDNDGSNDDVSGYGGYPDNGKIARGAQLTPNGFRDRGDSAVIEDDAFKTDSNSEELGAGTGSADLGVAKAQLVVGKDQPGDKHAACIPGASDIANPFILNMPASESAANKAKSAVGNFAKGALGGMFRVPDRGSVNPSPLGDG